MVLHRLFILLLRFVRGAESESVSFSSSVKTVGAIQVINLNRSYCFIIRSFRCTVSTLLYL